MKPILTLAILSISFTTVFASKPTALEVGPGPIEISAEERAQQSDSEHGIEHAVIFLEETDRNENVGAAATIQFYHMRAKVLSPDGRDIANVTIPFKREELKRWWGKVLLPDGKVLDLPITRLDDQSLVERKGRRLASISKAVLPGVVPGAVIDYGYEARSPLNFGSPPIDLQRAYLIKRFRYRWEPRNVGSIAASFALTNGAKPLPLHSTVKNGSVVLEGENLSPLIEEPYSPPEWEISGKLLLYYSVLSGEDSKEYWRVIGKNFDELVTSSTRKQSVWKNALGQIPLPANADLLRKLRAVYDWLGYNITNSSLQSNEEEELADESDGEIRRTTSEILEQRKASSFEFATLFIGFARFLGADAKLVMSVDRRRQYWMRDYMSTGQFSAFLVGLTLPGQAADKPIIVAAGSGLPFGEVPWYYTGVSGAAMTALGAVPVQVLPANADRNVSSTKATLTFSEEDQSMHAAWKRTATGQAGMDERRYLRSLAPDEREKRSAEICGESGQIEVETHETPRLDEPAAPLQLECDAVASDVGPTEEIDSYHFDWTGAWIEPLPTISEEHRVHPVIFPYPRTDSAEVTINAPPGFVPETGLKPSVITSQFGRYERNVSIAGNTVVINRTLVLTPLIVNTAAYPELLEFLRQARKHDAERVVFSRSATKANE